MDRKCPFPYKVEKWACKNHTTGWKVEKVDGGVHKHHNLQVSEKFYTEHMPV